MQFDGGSRRACGASGRIDEVGLTQGPEVGELARIMNHQFGPKKKKSTEADQDLALELADVLFVLLALANEQGIRLDDALEGTLSKYRARDSERWAPKVENDDPGS